MGHSLTNGKSWKGDYELRGQRTSSRHKVAEDSSLAGSCRKLSGVCGRFNLNIPEKSMSPKIKKTACLEYLLYPMPWMKYLKASVSLPGCREKKHKGGGGIISPLVINYYTCLHNIDRLNFSSSSSLLRVWDMTAAMNRCCAGWRITTWQLCFMSATC